MSKINKVIAGLGVCAGLGVALAPFSVFATDSAAVGTVTDKLQITTQDSITFGLDVDGDGTIEPADGDVAPVTHTDGAGSWAGGTGTHLTTDTLSKSMAAGETSDSFGTTALTVFATKGYNISAVGNSIAPESGQTALPMGAYSASATGWQYKPTVTGMNLVGVTADTFTTAPAASTIIASNAGASAAAGDTLTVVYGVGIASNAAGGTYVGSMVYTVSPAS